MIRNSFLCFYAGLLVIVLSPLSFAGQKVNLSQQNTSPTIQNNMATPTVSVRGNSDNNLNNSEPSEEKAVRLFEHSLDILNSVTGLIGVLVGLISILLAVAGIFGWTESRKWIQARQEAPGRQSPVCMGSLRITAR